MSLLKRILGRFRKTTPSPLTQLVEGDFGLKVRQPEIYILALTHKSVRKKGEPKNVENYERLEFLGDAILSSIAAEYCYQRFPNKTEGELSKIRAKIVNGEQLIRLARAIGIDRMVIKDAKTQAESLYGDVFEALLGAIYLEHGYDKTRAVVIDHIFANYMDIDRLDQQEFDFKSRLIESAQKQGEEIVFDTTPLPEGEKVGYRTEIRIAGELVATADGKSKRKADQNAAKKALAENRGGK